MRDSHKIATIHALGTKRFLLTLPTEICSLSEGDTVPYIEDREAVKREIPQVNEAVVLDFRRH